MKILAWRLSDFEAIITTFNNKAKRFGLPLIAFVITNRYIEEREQVTVFEGEESVNKIAVEMLDIDIQGDTPSINGWKVHSRIERNDSIELGKDAPNYVFTHPSAEFKPGLATARLYCDHCKSARLKKRAFWLRHEDGREMMVGADCLKDFMPPWPIESLLSYMGRLNDIYSDVEDMDREPVARQNCVYPTKDVIEQALFWIHKIGFLSKGKWSEMGEPFDCQPTSELIDFSKNPKKVYKGPTPELSNEADAVLRFLKSTLVAEKSGFEQNLLTAIGSDYTTWRMFAFLAAGAHMFIRHCDQERAVKAVRKSEWVGKVGQRELFKDMQVLRCTPREGDYGTTYIYGFADKEGRQFTWFGSKHIGDPGQTFDLKATIKGHDEYQGTKQTVITRCSVV